MSISTQPIPPTRRGIRLELMGRLARVAVSATLLAIGLTDVRLGAIGPDI